MRLLRPYKKTSALQRMPFMRFHMLRRLRSSVVLSADMIKRRDEWMTALASSVRDHERVAFRMANAATPGEAWQHVIASLVADKPLKRAPMRKSFLAAIEAEKLVAKSTSSSSIHNPAPAKVTISRGKRLPEQPLFSR